MLLGAEYDGYYGDGGLRKSRPDGCQEASGSLVGKFEYPPDVLDGVGEELTAQQDYWDRARKHHSAQPWGPFDL